MSRPQENDLKFQRDRFLAFAFAGADLLIEINATGDILFASGAAKALTGYDDKELLHKAFNTLFAHSDTDLIKTLQGNTKMGAKQGPYLVTLKNASDPTKTRRVFLSSFALTSNESVYVTITQVEGLLRIMGFEDDPSSQKAIATLDNFEDMLRKKMPSLMDSNQATNLQLVQLDNIESYKKIMAADEWAGMMSSIAQIVMESSIDGETAVQVDNGKYMLLQDDADADAKLQEKIMALAKDYKIDALNLHSKTVDGDLQSLSAREATRAILYTMNRMEKNGLDSCGTDLKGSFNAYLEENTTKITNLKRIISHQEFKIHFQPIVDMQTRGISHHEVLVRFDANNNSPYELITMGEDIGIAPDMDLSICRQTLKYADMNKKKNIGKLAVNLSGASVQNEIFVAKILATLKEYPEAAKHLLFEITESSEIRDLDKVDKVIQQLRKGGYAVCLDDFGAGAASFQYLHKLQVDGIKIDGAYVKSILTSPRDATMVKNVTKMCHELGVYVVAEMIETEDQAKYLRDIGVDKGQGWLFGKAAADTLPIGK